MKLRWREHEMIFVTILLAMQIILPVLIGQGAFAQTDTDFANRFRENGLPFVYWKNVLLPQMASVLLMYIIYLLINLVILPLIKKISFEDFEKLLSLNNLLAVLAFTGTGYLLAIGINVITYYGRPHLFNYADYQFLAIGGYNDAPLTNLFAGFQRSLMTVALFTGFASAREFVCWLIERPNPGKAFRVFITNNITPLVFLYFLSLLLLNPVHTDFVKYVSTVTPVLILYIYTTFWLFPFKGNGPFFRKAVLWRLLLSGLVCALFFISIIGSFHPVPFFLLYWAFLLFIIVPLSWLLYQQRKDKILHLKGLEKDLAKSGADLQFLRSQINPHFLFNALNTLYGTALKENSEHTAEGIQKLGDMMRFMLHENNLDFIPMTKEINYLKNYIALQKLRTESSDNIVIEDNIEEANCEQMIAPMLLIPFVENAFKHGISLQERSWISILLHCSDDGISFEVKNSVHSRNSGDPEKYHSGIGLKNVTERLKLLYPGSHRISITDSKEEFIVNLVIDSVKN